MNSRDYQLLERICEKDCPFACEFVSVIALHVLWSPSPDTVSPVVWSHRRRRRFVCCARSYRSALRLVLPVALWWRRLLWAWWLLHACWTPDSHWAALALARLYREDRVLQIAVRVPQTAGRV